MLIIETSTGSTPIVVVRDDDKAESPPETWFGTVSDDGQWITFP